MAVRRRDETLRWLETLGREGSSTGLEDGQLLDRFLSAAGPAAEAAFEALVRRHGPMVLGICRGVLRDDHDADDAFQATFLVLARRAVTVRDHERLGAWLARAARRIALRSRKLASRRRAREASEIEVEALACESPYAALVACEAAASLRTEVDRLPEPDRVLLHMTYWQGRSYDEAAAEIARPIGTVRSRLARARLRLRERLGRYGLAVPIAPPPAVHPPEALIQETVRIAVGFAGEGWASTAAGTVPTAVTALVEGELAMTTIRWGLFAAGLIAGGAMTAGGMALASRGGGGVPRIAPAPAATTALPAPPPGKPSAALPLKNAGFEEGKGNDPTAWSRGADIPGVQYVWSPGTAHGGKASLSLKKTAQRYFPIAQWTQEVARAGDEPRLKVAAWIKAEKAGKAILDAQFLDAQGEWSHAWVAYIGAKEADDPPASHDWKRYEGVVAIPPGTRKIIIAPQIYGPGTVWFDDVEAEYADAPATDPVATTVK